MRQTIAFEMAIPKDVVSALRTWLAPSLTSIPPQPAQETYPKVVGGRGPSSKSASPPPGYNLLSHVFVTAIYVITPQSLRDLRVAICLKRLYVAAAP